MDNKIEFYKILYAFLSNTSSEYSLKYKDYIDFINSDIEHMYNYYLCCHDIVYEDLRNALSKMKDKENKTDTYVFKPIQHFQLTIEDNLYHLIQDNKEQCVIKDAYYSYDISKGVVLDNIMRFFAIYDKKNLLKPLESMMVHPKDLGLQHIIDLLELIYSTNGINFKIKQIHTTMEENNKLLLKINNIIGHL